MRTYAKIITALTALAFPFGVLAQETDWKVLTHYEKAPIKKQLAQRLTDYVTFDTQAQPSAKVPSSAGQLKLAKALAKELKKNGAANVKVDKFGIVTAEIPSTLTKPVPALAFLAHLDTAPEFSGKNVQPKTHTYKGAELVISADKNLTLNTYNSPQLTRAKGHEIITASGNTLLGADGKAGIAILLTAVQYLYDHPQIAHGPIKIVFTPDSTTGAGVQHLDVPALGADYAYTLDAAEAGQLVDETFSSKTFKVIFDGNRQMDIGHAFNASFADNVLMASDFHTLLPRYKRPETTAYKNGFIFVDNIVTQQDHTEITGQIRAFSEDEMNALTAAVQQAFQTVKGINPSAKKTSLTFAEQDKNIKASLPPQALTLAERAMETEEITPQRTAARSTTDGARLAQKGLAAAGLFTGYYHAPGLLEYADVDIMEMSFRTVLRLISLYAWEPPAK